MRACRARSGVGRAAGQSGGWRRQGRRRLSDRRAHAILIDADSGSVLFEKDADDLIPPGQPLQADDGGSRLQRDQAGPAQARRPNSPSATNAWRRGGAPRTPRPCSLAIHSKVAVDDLLHGVIIQSGNDACIVLAEGIAGNENEFAEQDDQARARDRPAQIDVRQFHRPARSRSQLMTARELAKLARHIIQTYPEYYKIYGEREFTWNKIRQLQPQSAAGDEYRRRRHEDRLHQGSRLRPRRLGGAEWLAADRGGQWPEERRRSAPTKASKLLEWGFQHFQSGMLFAEGQEIAEAKVYGGDQRPRAAGRRQGRQA